MTATTTTSTEINAIFKKVYSEMKWGGQGIYFEMQTRPLPWFVEEEGGYCIQRPYWRWWGLERESYSGIGRSVPVWGNT